MEDNNPVQPSKEEKRPDAALNEIESRYHLLMENVKDYAIFMLDPGGCVLSWNAGAERTLGYTEGEVLGRHFSRLFTPEDIRLGEPEKELSQAAAKGRAEDERWHIRKDGSRFWAIGTLTALRDESGTLRGFTKVLRDSTERKRLEDALRQRAEELSAADRSKDEFIATLSHELRTPLNAILGWAHLVRSGKLDQKTAEHALHVIERNAMTQARLIEDLLDVSRIVTGKIRLDVRPVELAPVIRAAVDSIRPAAEAKSIQVDVALDPSVGPISGDSSRLQQVIWNLLSNAIKFTPKQGRVEIRLERIDSNALVVVSDTGMGIPPDFLPYVFDRFRQGDTTITRSQGGLGLGLAIVRHLVELHGGTVRAESLGENQGATFKIWLPLAAVRLERVLPKSPSDLLLGEVSALKGLKVLVVDDETDTRDLLTTVLERCGVIVFAVASVSEALNVLEKSKPDILVSDIGMPREDGYDLIRRVRSLPAAGGGHIPAVALTAYARTEDRVRILSAGYQIHIPKPVDPMELATAIANLVGQK